MATHDTKASKGPRRSTRFVACVSSRFIIEYDCSLEVLVGFSVVQ